jgi:signal transduction histidine kinase
MEALGTLAGGIAHDFNNILTGIVGYTELSIEDAPKDSIMYQSLLEVLKLGARAKDLVSQILAFSHKNANKNQRLDIEKVLKETVSMLRATLPATIVIKVNHRYSPAMIYADPTEIQQLVMNLCINAEFAMKDQGGTIDISLDRDDNVPESYIRINSLQPGGFIRLSIKDTGCGMDKRTMKRIFEPFFTTKGVQEGTGLGLSVVHGIVTRHEGFITVDSELGKGSTFNVYLPLAEDVLKLQKY